MPNMGIGAFFGGAVKGYDEGLEQNRKAEELKMRKQEFGLKKQLGEIELRKAKEEEDFRNDLKTSLAPIIQEMQPQPAAQNGIQPTDGTAAAQPAPVDLPSLTRRFADTSLSVAFKHGRVDLGQLKAARDLRKQLDDENVDEAVRTWQTTGDKSKVAEIFNKGGKVKFDPETMEIQTVKDPNGIIPDNVIVTQRQKDGTMKPVFDYQSYALAGISKDAYSALVADAKKTTMKEKGDTFRTGMTTQATLGAAQINAAASRDKKLDPEVVAFNDRMNKEFEAIFKGTGYNLNPREETYIRAQVSDLGRRLIDTGMNANQAYLAATQAVFTKNKIPVDLSRLK